MEEVAMNRKTSWKETIVLKKSILLTIVLAILITLSASTFSLFNITDSVGTSKFSTKIFDVYRANTDLVPDIIYEPDFIENSSPWIFVAFNSSEVEDYDTLIEVTLIDPELNYGMFLDKLQVGLYEQNNSDPLKPNLLSMVHFSGDTANLFIPEYFSGIVPPKTSKILSLQFFYNGDLINPENNPFVPGKTKFSAKVWGDNYLKNIIDNNWFYVKTKKYGKNKIKCSLCVNSILEDLFDNGTINSPDTLTINYYKQIGDVAAYMEILYIDLDGSQKDLYTFEKDAAYRPPDVIAIRNDELPPSSSMLAVNSLLFNQNLYSVELPDNDHEWFIYRNFQTTAAGFQISIEFTNSNADFTIYVGNE